MSKLTQRQAIDIVKHSVDKGMLQLIQVTGPVPVFVGLFEIVCEIAINSGMKKAQFLGYCKQCFVERRGAVDRLKQKGVLECSDNSSEPSSQPPSSEGVPTPPSTPETSGS